MKGHDAIKETNIFTKQLNEIKKAISNQESYKNYCY